MNEALETSSPQRPTAAWHTLPVETVLSHLESTRSGLASAEANRRLGLGVYGRNELQVTRRTTAWKLLLEQFQNVLIVILLAATVLSAFMGHAVEAAAIAVIVLFSVLLGFIQEYRADRAIQSLREMAAPLAKVLRDGREVDLPARDLVPGDVILLRAGDKIAADVRLIEAVNLQVEEAVLTGESMAVEKRSDSLANRDAALGDRTNMAYAGTAVSYGRGLVVATGRDSR